MNEHNVDMIIAIGYRTAEREFAIYRQREMRQLKSDFDKAVSGYLGGPTDPK